MTAAIRIRIKPPAANSLYAGASPPAVDVIVAGQAEPPVYESVRDALYADLGYAQVITGQEVDVEGLGSGYSSVQRTAAVQAALDQWIADHEGA